MKSSFGRLCADGKDLTPYHTIFKVRLQRVATDSALLSAGLSLDNPSYNNRALDKATVAACPI
jgi:hypothetical protein